MNSFLNKRSMTFCLILCLACGQEEQKDSNSQSTDDLGSDNVIANNIDVSRDPRPDLGYQSMLILGDSIAAGFLSDTKLGDGVGVSQAGDTISLDFSDRASFSLSLGDLFDVSSLTFRDEVIFDSFMGLNDDYSTAVSSFYGGIDYPEDTSSLAYLLGMESSAVDNYSIPGFRVGDIYTILDNGLPKDAFDGKDLVVLEIGANDFCLSEAESGFMRYFEDNYRAVLEQIANAAPNAKLVVVPVPNIPSILENSGGQIVFTMDASPVGKHDFKCRNIQRHFCPRFFGDKRNTAAGLISAMNRKIEALVEEAKSEYGMNISLVKGLTEPGKFSPNMLAVDCFHPGVNGYPLISAETLDVLSAE